MLICRAPGGAGGVRGGVVDELAGPFRPLAGEREQLVARLVPAPPPALGVEEVRERRASHRSGEIDGDLVPGAHGCTSDGSGSNTRA